MSHVIAFTHFRTVPLELLDAALFNLTTLHELDTVDRMVFFDNNTTHDVTTELMPLLDRYRQRLPPILEIFEKHGDAAKTQSYSVNAVMRECVGDVVFHSRSDFLLAPDILTRFRAQSTPRRLVTSWCYQMGYDVQLSNADAVAEYSLPEAPWRQHPDGPVSLIGVAPANRFQDCDKDPGVWMLHADAFAESGGLDERLTAWGFQTQEWIARWKHKGLEVTQIEAYLFFHQHHYAPRDFRVAHDEFRKYIR